MIAKQYLIFFVLTFLLIADINAENLDPINTEDSAIPIDDIKKISYYQGYLLYNNILKSSLENFDFDQVLEGLKEAHNGSKELKVSDDEIRIAIKNYQQYLFKKKQKENLVKAQKFLKDQSAKEGVKELIKDKLYYKILKDGAGPKIHEKDMPLLTYAIKEVINSEEDEMYKEENPKAILLEATIEGFAKGVIGMQEGERRILFIHPDLAYGVARKLSEPNIALVIEVEACNSNSNER